MEHGELVLIHLLQWISILFIVSYFTINNIVYNKGYLMTDSSIISTTISTAKVVGLDVNGVIFDSADIIYPPFETNTLFITTSIINTPNQTRGICTHDNGRQCTTNTQCKQYEYTETDAIYTGICNTSINICSVYSWCPIPSYHSQQTISNIGNGSIFLDINILFPLFDVVITKNQIPFYIDNIIGNATNGTLNAMNISQNGIIILMVSEWNCNLDLPLNECIPHFSYYRIDDKGFEFKNAWYHSNGNERMLQERFGIRIIFASHGTATKTNIPILIFNICIGIILSTTSLIIAYYLMKMLLPKSISPPQNTNDMVFISPSISNSISSMKYEGIPNETLMGHCNM